MNNRVNNVVPMITEPLQEFSVSNDLRFTKVKLWLMHLGLNHNGSIFTKEVVEKAIPTLSNTPIVGSVGFDSNGEVDFKGHEIDLQVSEDGEIKLINKTVPYGVIPADHNAKFETRIGDDGMEREYLTCEGLLWNKWDDAVDIIINKSGTTGQSMELSNEYSGKFKGGTFEFADFKFNGACLLGKDEMPAMENSTVEMIFTQKAQDYIDNKIEMYNLSFTKEEGGQTLTNKEKVETEEIEKQVDTEKEVEKKADEVETKEVEKKPTRKAATKKQEVKEEEQEDKKAEESPLDRITVVEENADTLVEVHAKKVEEAAKSDKPLDRIQVLDNEYTAKDIEDLLAEKARLENELFSLQKQNKDKAVNELFSIHEGNLTSEEIKDLRAKDFEPEELEVQIFSLIGRKAYTSQKEVKTSEDNKDIAPIFTKFDSNEDKQQSPYGGLFEQYLNK